MTKAYMDAFVHRQYLKAVDPSHLEDIWAKNIQGSDTRRGKVQSTGCGYLCRAG